ncbi:hypothetical protein FRB98_002373 [Tulasnella sp. 332]|nr:hypothetical protein FRB98_002373 [Tulasnella sp. 332]
MSVWTRGKAAVPYVVGGTKITLDVLSKVAGLISPPCVQTIINGASQIITIIEGVKANRDDSKTLAGRLLGLLTVISETYKDKTDEDVPPDVKSSLRRLQTQLDDILAEIREMRLGTDPHTFKGLFKGILLYGDNGGKIRECTARIDWAMNVEGRIGDSLRLLDVAEDTRHIRAVVQGDHVIAQDTNHHVVAIHQEIANITIRAPPSAVDALPSSSIIPSRPLKLYGRDEDIEDIARRIITTDSPRYAILGPGGIGKTALLMFVMDHPDVVEKYEASRYFVQCEQATSSALFIELVAKGLGIEESSRDQMNDVMARLRRGSQPILFALDNFETPWDIVGEQSRVESILCQITSLPHVGVLLTARSDRPPSTDVPWSVPWLDPLSGLREEAGRALYMSMDPKAGSDGSLDALLAELSYMPLAIKLMASMGRSGQRPTALLQAWRDKAGGTDLFRGTDKNKSVKMSIQLSIESNLMKSVPEALTLLSLIAMLPAGANIELLPTLARDIPNLPLAQATLSEATLARVDDDTQAIQLLSPIRSYILKHHPASDSTKQTVYDAYVQFIIKHNAAYGSASFLSDARVLSTEETNLEAILPLSIRSGSHPAIEAAIDFSGYQYWTRPRLEVITCVVDACRRNGGLGLLARGLKMSGDICISLADYGEARASYEEAAGVYRELGDRQGTADCLIGLGNVHRMQGRYREAEVAYQKASDVYGELGNRLGTANCLRGLGHVHLALGRYPEAEVAYQKASDVYGELGYRPGTANCLFSLGDVHLAQGRVPEAQVAYEKASDVYGELGNRRGTADCLRGLGDIHRMQGRHPEAEVAYGKASDVHGELGDRKGTASCLSSLGDVHGMQGRHREAKVAYQKASDMYGELGYRLGTANCLSSLGRVHQIQGQYREAEVAYQKASDVYGELGNRLGTANCLRGLGDVHLMQGQHREAEVAYQKASDMYRELGHRRGTADGLFSFGAVYLTQGRYPEAQVAYQKASDMYGEFGYRLGTANCLLGLGEVHRIQGQYREAEVAWQNAFDMYGELGGRLGSANCLRGLGQLYKLQARYSDGYKAFSEAKMMYEGMGMVDDAADCSRLLDSIPTKTLASAPRLP